MRRAAEEAERGRDRGQRRAQLVTHRGDELVLQALHLLALADIDDDAENHRSFLGMDRIETHLQRELGAVLAYAEQLPAQSHAATRGAATLGPEPFAATAVLRAQARRHQHVDRLADQLVAAIAEHLLGLGIDDRYLPAAVHHDDAAGVGINREPEHLFRLDNDRSGR